MSKQNHNLTVVTLLLLACCNVHLLAIDAIPRVDDLILMAKSVHENIHSIDVTFNVEQEVVNSSPGYLKNNKTISFLEHRLIVDLESDRFFWHYKKPLLETNNLSTTEIAYDGNIQTQYLANDKLGSIIEEKPQSSINARKRLRVLGAMLALPPKEGGLGIDDGSMINFLRHGILRKGSEDIDGRPCLVVDYIVNGVKGVTVWIDVDRGLIPLKLVTYNKSGEIGSEQKIKKIQEFDAGNGNSIWLPIEIEWQVNFSDHSTKSITRVDTDKTKVNLKLDNEMFRVKFPPGTEVHDFAKNFSFTIPDITPELDSKDLSSLDSTVAKNTPTAPLQKEDNKKHSVIAHKYQTKNTEVEQTPKHHSSLTKNRKISIIPIRDYLPTIFVGIGLSLALIALFSVKRRRN